MVSEIIDLIKNAFRWLRNFVRKVIAGILDFLTYVVNYFKNLRLQKNKHVPFIADADKLRDMIKSAPTKNVGIFEGVYNEETNQIENAREVDADDVDQQTENILGNETLVVLS